MVWKVIRTTLTGGRSSAGHRVEALHLGVGIVVGEQREQVGDRDAVLDLAGVLVVPAADVDRGARLGLAQPLERGELGGLVLGDLSRDPVAHDDLDGRGERGRGERDGERHASRSGSGGRAATTTRTAPATRKPDDDVGRQVHVDELRPQVRVAEQGGHRLDVDRTPVLQPEPRRVVHPRVDREDHQRAR